MRARAQGYRDYFGLVTLAVWQPKGIDEALPRTDSIAERQARRDAEMGSAVAHINAVMRARQAKKAANG